MNATSWECWHGGIRQGRRSTVKAAMNLVDRPFVSGNASVRNVETGEEWERRMGSWNKIEPAKSRKEIAAARAAKANPL